MAIRWDKLSRVAGVSEAKAEAEDRRRNPEPQAKALR
jgi:hypothetical protein